MFVVVAYDISEDDRRFKVARVLLDYGRRVQKSVFECLLTDRQLTQVRTRLEELIDMDTDSVRYYPICQRCLAAVQVSGLGTVTDDDLDAPIII